MTIASSQAELISGEHGGRLLNYWRETLDGLPDRLTMPTDRTRGRVSSGAGSVHRFRIAGAVVERLEDFATRRGCTLYVALLALFQVQLYRYLAYPVQHLP